MTGVSTNRRERRIVYATRNAVNRFFSATARLKKSYRRGRPEAIGCQGPTVVGEPHGANSWTARNSAEHLVTSAIRNREDPRFLDTVYMTS